jgi:5-methyltetrahydropteroyltriglutamate--homocysteine methyltransferase
LLVTVVGNYPKIPNRPRPARLRNALNRLDRGEISRAEVERVEREVTVEVMAEQAKAGVDLVTDGQIRWDDEVTYIMRRLANVSLSGLIRLFDTNTYYREPVIGGPINWQGPITVADFEFARANSPVPVKPVLTGPCTLARLSRDTHYRNIIDLALALAEALNLEARALQSAGATLVQFNEPGLARFPGDAAIAREAWRRLLDGLSVEAAVYFYFGAPDGALPVAVESGFTTVGVDATIPGVLDKVKAGPRPQKLAAGIVDSRTTRMETDELISSRLRAAAAIVPPDRLYVNPNMGLEFLPREQAEEKLRRLSSAARKALEG